jgi:hypothetical protein
MNDPNATRAADTPPPACWAVIAYRWGWINGHQYIVRVTNDLQAAMDAADAEAMHRGGTYGVTVWDSDGAQVYHSPSSYREAAAHVNYRKEMFEAVGLHVVVGLEDGKPLTADEIATRWRQEVRMQEIMERADHNQPNAHGDGSAVADTVRRDVGVCRDPQHPEHNGKPCACWDCNHVEGVCVSHESGSGCGVCEGPVAPGECDLTLVDTDGDDLCNPNTQAEGRQ